MNIYVHIPFCHSKCAYCAFLSHCNITKEDEYVKALCHEIENCKLKIENSTDTVYFGGGTPSLIKAENIAKIIETITTRSVLVEDAEITLECNPEDITKEKLERWKTAGVNRLSIGIQTFNDKVRIKMGRSLTSEEAIKRVKLAQRYFENVGIDLISGLPGDSFDSLEARGSLLEAVSHVSIYDLETDNNSTIGRKPGQFNLPTEKDGAKMLVSAWNLLETLGFKQYEISNFAINGKYCRHNLDFWQGKDYIGFGLGATSRVGDKIITNTDNFEHYLSENCEQTVETLSPSEFTRWHLVAAMRLNKSFKDQLFEFTGNTNLPEELLELELVTTEHTLTQRGKLMYNQVVSKLIG